MKRTAVMLIVSLAVGFVLGAVSGQKSNAQPTPAKTATLLQTDVVGLPGKEVVVQAVDFAPGATSGKHTHPGHEVAYILAGSATRYVEGKGWVPAKPGDVFYIPDHVVHETKNLSTTEELKLLVFRIHEKGKPIVNLRIEEASFWTK